MLPQQFTLLDSVGALILVLDSQARVLFANRAFCDLLGYPIESIAGKPPGDFLFSLHEIPAIMQAMAQQAEQPGDAAPIISVWKSFTGEERVVAWNSRRYLDPDLPEHYAILSGADITDRKQIEKLLEREQRLLRSLIDSIPDLIFYKDTQGVYLGCNTAFEQFSGRSVAEIASGRTDADFYPPDLAARFLESDRRVLEEHQSLSYENWRAAPDGQRTLIETRKTPYYGPNGEVLGVIGVGRDITKHRMAEEALRKANAEIEQLIASLSSILVVTNAELRVLRWNPMAEKILGIGAPAAIGQRLNSLAVSWDWAAVESGLNQCGEELCSVYLPPTRFRRPNGSEGYLGVNVSPLQEEDGQVSGYILLGADITERKILENRLAQAQKLESIGQLAAGIAHEINTPIQYVSDNVHFLQDSFDALATVLDEVNRLLTSPQNPDSLPAQVRSLRQSAEQADLVFLNAEIPAAIQQSLEGIQRVSSIVRAMKEFSHPGVKQKTPIDLNKALENTLTVSRNEWKYAADAETKFDPDLPSVWCLPGEINQVFINLIVNAADAIKDVVGDDAQNKGRLRLQTRRDGDWVEVRIADSGAGIPDEIANRVFEPFFTTKAVGKGTGQGLAIAYDVIVVKHGGAITFESIPGQGTTFIIRLPIQG